MNEKDLALWMFGIEADADDDLSALTPLVEKIEFRVVDGR
jgi:hypothetical protein